MTGIGRSAPFAANTGRNPRVSTHGGPLPIRASGGELPQVIGTSLSGFMLST